MSSIWKKTLLATFIAGASCVANANILTSIKPLGFIAAAVANGVTTTEVLIPPTASPHDYSLKPSDIQKLQQAGLVVWIGEDIDSFLEKNIEKLPASKVLTLEDVKQIEPLLGEAAEHYEHNDNDHDHNHDHNHNHDNDLDTNWHIWLSPTISKIIAAEIAEKLIAQYPEKKALIEQNLTDFNLDLAKQSSKITTQLAPLKDKGFYVFHDAYRYFEDAYGLKQTGYFTINPLVAPGAKTLAEIKEKLEHHQVQCLFTEPQFTPKVVELLSRNTTAKIGQLDPLGSNIQISKHAYTEFLQQLADDFSNCLK